MKYETRACKRLEVRASADSKFIGTLTGYAAVFNSESEDFGGWKEVIRPGAFARSLKQLPDVRALMQHVTGDIIARAGNVGTLRLQEDDAGLKVEIDLIDTQVCRDCLANVRAGLLDAMSFGFMPVPGKSKWSDAGEYALRELLDVDLFEVSVVTWPAYADTEIGTRELSTFKAQSGAEKTQTTPFRLLRAKTLQARHN